METQKNVNLLKKSENKYSKFETKKFYVIDNQSGGKYSPDDHIKLLTKSSLCDFSDPYVLVTANIAVAGANNNAKVAFKNCELFRKCKKEINDTFINEANFINIQWLCTI